MHLENYTGIEIQKILHNLGVLARLLFGSPAICLHM